MHACMLAHALGELAQGMQGIDAQVNVTCSLCQQCSGKALWPWLGQSSLESRAWLARSVKGPPAGAHAPSAVEEAGTKALDRMPEALLQELP